MIYISYIVIGILLVLCVFQYRRINSNQFEIKQMALKLEQIVDHNSQESLHVFTDDKYLQELLSSINQVLDMNKYNQAEKIRYQDAMGKMLSNVSHDLKTPLTVINGYIETLLLSKELSETEREKLYLKVNNKSKELISLINQFFDLAKLESKDKTLELSKININELCRHRILTFFEQVQDKKLQMDIDIPDNDYFIQANEEALRRALNNLITNSIKYGYQGGVLGLRVYKESEFIYVEVWDKGKGIDEKFYAQVFERLYTLEDSRNKDYQGSGLGLTITKRLIEQMNGEIALTSEPNIRTSFIIKFHELK